MHKILLALALLVSPAMAGAPGREFVLVAKMSAADKKAMGSRLAEFFFSFSECKALGGALETIKPIADMTLSRFDMVCTEALSCIILTPAKAGDAATGVEFTEFSASAPLAFRGDNGAMTLHFGKDANVAMTNVFSLPGGVAVRMCRGTMRMITERDTDRWLKAIEKFK